MKKRKKDVWFWRRYCVAMAVLIIVLYGIGGVIKWVGRSYDPQDFGTPAKVETESGTVPVEERLEELEAECEELSRQLDAAKTAK